MATKVKENEDAEVERDGASDGPLLDLSDDAVKIGRASCRERV